MRNNREWLLIAPIEGDEGQPRHAYGCACKSRALNDDTVSLDSIGAVRSHWRLIALSSARCSSVNTRMSPFVPMFTRLRAPPPVTGRGGQP